MRNKTTAKAVLALIVWPAGMWSQTVINGSRTILGELNASASTRMRIRTGAGAPAAGDCDSAGKTGSVYARSDASSPAASLYLCSQTGPGVFAWELVQDAVKLQGRNVGSAAPADGDALVWSAPNNRWQPGAVSGGGPPISSGPASVMPLGWPTATGSGVLGTANRVFLIPVLVPARMQLGRVNLEVMTAGAAGVRGAVGLYDATCGTLLASSAEIGAEWESTGVKSHAFQSPVTVPAGAYYLGVATNSASIAFRVYSGSSVITPIWIADPNASSVIGWGSATAGGAPYSLPASCGTLTESSYNLPVTVIKP